MKSSIGRRTLGLALVLALSLSATAFAESISTNGGTGTTTITTTTDPTYTVTIPESQAITFGDTSTDLGSVELSSARLESGYAVTVTAAAGALTNDDDAAVTIPYTLTSEGRTFTSVMFAAAGDSTDLNVEIEQVAWDSAPAGSYTGTITFTISYARQ
ncbi:MAG: hypothetical protein LIO42_01645 [Oscillospiraceae bacterium]|nr:hypothetical protein [Oscillospiraceae bacterium]